MSGPKDGLSIGELARRTGVPAATLRSWEDRYGFPRPQRLNGGHRRYAEGDMARIAEVLRLRTSGMSLQAAIGQAAAREPEAELSVFAGLRRRHPALVPTELSKATLLAMTRAIEDECYARAEQAALFAGFQRERFYRYSTVRWQELAGAFSPGLDRVLANLPSVPPAPASADLQRAIGLFNRMAAYLDHRTSP